MSEIAKPCAVLLGRVDQFLMEKYCRQNKNKELFTYRTYCSTYAYFEQNNFRRLIYPVVLLLSLSSRINNQKQTSDHTLLSGLRSIVGIYSEKWNWFDFYFFFCIHSWTVEYYQYLSVPTCGTRNQNNEENKMYLFLYTSLTGKGKSVWRLRSSAILMWRFCQVWPEGQYFCELVTCRETKERFFLLFPVC